MRLISWNLNGIRAVAKKGLIEKLLNVAVKFVGDCISKEAFDC